MRVLKLVSIFTLSVFALFCSDKNTKNVNEKPVIEPTRELTQTEKKLSNSGNSFSLGIFKELAKEDNSQNVFISPLSLSIALGMAFNGADETTKTEMENVLGFNGMSVNEINESYKSLMELLLNLDPKVQMKIANSIWYRDTLSVSEEFINTNADFFDAKVEGLNFQNSDSSAKVINSWVKDKTEGKIESIISEISKWNMMFLINAIYFKADWSEQFDKRLTYEAPFKVSENVETKVKMMRQTKYFPYFENDSLQIVDLPYGDKKFRMTIFLPSEIYGVEKFITDLNDSSWAGFTEKLYEKRTISYEGVEVHLPKVELEYQFEFKKLLEKLGMVSAFDTSANFDKITGNRNDLLISSVNQKTFLKVDEEGTEAAAVTAIGFKMSDSEPIIKIMKIDRPFVFAIREKDTNTILFMGKIENPKSN